MDLESPSGIGPDAWELLVMRVKNKQCTPVVGPMAVESEVPQWSEALATCLAARPEYPDSNDRNLLRVAQWLKYSGFDAPGLYVAKYIHDCEARLDDLPRAYRALAELRLPLYITTNVDSRLTAALEERVAKVETAHYAWKRFETMDHVPTVHELDPDAHAVFHLLGQAAEPNSLVLSEDDLIDFAGTAAVTGGNGNLPSLVRVALSRSALLFIGYRPEDWTFRLLLRGLLRLAQIKRTSYLPSINLQFDPIQSRTERQDIDAYFNDYLGHVPLKVFWVEPEELVTSLAEVVGSR